MNEKPEQVVSFRILAKASALVKNKFKSSRFLIFSSSLGKSRFLLILNSLTFKTEF